MKNSRTAFVARSCLTALIVTALAAFAPLCIAESDQRVFRSVLRKPGDDGSKAYRIPGLATTPTGTLLAVFDIRHDGPGDLPGNIDVGLMRSTDNGATWSPMQRVLDFDAKQSGSRGNGVGDPAILVDRETGAVFVTALWSKGDRAWQGSGPGMAPEETGQLVLAKSTDDGATWSEPINITSQVKQPAWRLCFQGPGAGIQTADGTLIFAAQFRDEGGAPHSCFIYSHDHGETWSISPPAIANEPPTSEAQIAELDDGALLLTMRDESRSGKRAWARWTWALKEADSQRTRDQTNEAGSWSAPWFTVPDPTCMASLIRHPHGELLFANPNSSKKRVALTVRSSTDGGHTWSDGRLLDPRGCMYSCMAVLADGRIGILYETEGTLTFARFPLAWVTEVRKLSLALPFSDHMVLQSDVEVPVWGTAVPHESVVVSFGTQTHTTRADEQGQWKVKLARLPSSHEPSELQVRSADEELSCRDVLVGEVWVCAGQSNMEWPLAAEAHAASEVPAANRPKVRLMNLSYAGQNYFAKPFDEDVRKRLTPDDFFHGTWLRCTPRSAERFSAIGYYFAKEVGDAIEPPIGVINLAVGGSPAEAWIRRKALADSPALRQLATGNWLENASLDDWCRQRGVENLGDALREGADMPVDAIGPNHPFKPAFLWESGIANLAPFPIRGILWYQGESNALELRRVQQHEQLFPLLVKDWREQWGIGDFPFLYCQLSSIGTEQGYKSQHWPEFRDSQRRMLGAIPNVGMIVTSDLGHPTDVHPRNKKEVGRRMALWALNKSYGHKTPFSGPLPGSIGRERSALLITFDHASAGLGPAEEPQLRGFEIAGADGIFHTARASLEGNIARISSDEVDDPASVRYGWRPYSIGNLVNAAGLPAPTFLLSLPEGK